MPDDQPIKEYPIAGELICRDGEWIQAPENLRAINLRYVTSVRQFHANSLLVSLVGEASAFAIISDYGIFVTDWRSCANGPQ